VRRDLQAQVTGRLKLKLIRKVYGLIDRPHLVIAVTAAAEYLKTEVDLSGS
jgi:hypothetical protein